MPSGALISAPSSNVVWVILGGEVLYRSTDRGTTWEQRGLPPVRHPGWIAFISDLEGWVTTTDPTGTGCPGNYRIWRTVDGGASYEEIDPKSLTGSACTGALVFADREHAFLTGRKDEVGHFIYRSNDGGRTWIESPPLRSGGVVASQVLPGAVRSFADTLLLPVTDYSRTEPRQAVYRSTDGGASWTHLSDAATSSPVALTSATRWIQLGGPGFQMETTDAGVTWRPLTTDYSQAAPVEPLVVFSDASVGYATVRGTIQRTIDGGAHWIQLRTPGTCCN